LCALAANGVQSHAPDTIRKEPREEMDLPLHALAQSCDVRSPEESAGIQIEAAEKQQQDEQIG
jgi:hypothetical protein